MLEGHLESSSRSPPLSFCVAIHFAGGVQFVPVPTPAEVEAPPNNTANTTTNTTTATNTANPQPFGPRGLQRLLQLLASLHATSPAPQSAVAASSLATALAALPAHARADAYLLGLAGATALFDACCSLRDWPPFVSYLQIDLGRGLLEQLHTGARLLVFAQACRVLTAAALCCRAPMKLHTEAFVVTLCRIALDPQAPNDIAEYAVDTLINLVKQKEAVIEWYANYDCDVYCHNLTQYVTDAMYHCLCPAGAQAVLPSGGSGSEESATVAPTLVAPLNLAALEFQLSFLASLARIIGAQQQQQGAAAATAVRCECSAAAQRVRLVKQKKALLALAAEKFNRSAKEGIEFLRTKKYLPDPPDPRSVALFLRHAPGLQKQGVGDYLAAKHDFNGAVLRDYILSFGLSGRPFLVAFREFIQSFMLPLDSNLINRILEVFGVEYCRANPRPEDPPEEPTGTEASVAGDSTKPDTSPLSGVSPFYNADACYILSYSVIILNVDQHNPKVKEPMTAQQFVSTNRGINKGRNIPERMLLEIYHTIKENEMRLPEELPSGVNTPLSTIDLVARVPRAAAWVGCAELRAPDFGRDVFAAAWSPVASSLCVAFETAADELTLERAVSGFELAVRIACFYGLSDIVDYVVIYLCRQTTLLQVTTLPFFAANRKAQSACAAVFGMARRCGALLRDGWPNVVHCIGTLHAMGLLHPEACPGLTRLIDFDNKAARKQAPKQQTTSGWLSSLIWGSDAAGGNEEDEDDEARRRAQECADRCDVRALLECPAAYGPSLMHLVKALANGSTYPKAAAEEARAAFMLDVLTKMLLLNEGGPQAKDVWALVSAHLGELLLPLPHASPFAEHAVVNAFTLSAHYLSSGGEALSLASELLCLVCTMKDEVLQELTDTIAACLSKLLPIRADVTAASATAGPALLCALNARGVDAVLRILALCGQHGHKKCYVRGFELLGEVVRWGAVLAARHHTAACATAVLAFACSPHAGTEGAAHCAELLHDLFAAAASPSDGVAMTADERWASCRAALDAVAQLCRDASLPAGARHHATTVLQRAALSPLADFASGAAWAALFRELLFPLLSDLLSEKLATTDADETRVRASTLLAKLFLQRLGALSQYGEFVHLWLQTVDVLERYMTASDSETLHEVIPEALKNMTLVMAHLGVFREGAPLWEPTWEALARVDPQLGDDIRAKLNAAASAAAGPQQQPAAPAASTEEQQQPAASTEPQPTTAATEQPQPQPQPQEAAEKPAEQPAEEVRQAEAQQ
eukprot:TRINITY_DN357_c1_g1_i4.p1 TRINITY_DN357_c1_g1~~TRINITY_DN357_c1_g1_i4.p1  ORF type:complete len:1269 (-),score=349.93 TRINITY_DN357_c1_g1_i4:49-3855(-)